MWTKQQMEAELKSSRHRDAHSSPEASGAVGLHPTFDACHLAEPDVRIGSRPAR